MEHALATFLKINKSRSACLCILLRRKTNSAEIRSCRLPYPTQLDRSKSPGPASYICMVYLERTNESEEANVVSKLLLGVLFWHGTSEVPLTVGACRVSCSAPACEACRAGNTNMNRHTAAGRPVGRFLPASFSAAVNPGTAPGRLMDGNGRIEEPWRWRGPGTRAGGGQRGMERTPGPRGTPHCRWSADCHVRVTFCKNKRNDHISITFGNFCYCSRILDA